MEAQSTVFVPLAGATREHGIAKPLQWAAIGLTILLWFVALVVAQRRASGAVSEPLETATLLGVGLMTAVMSAAIRVLMAFERRAGDTRSLNALLLHLPRLAAVVLGISIWLPETSLLDGLMFCIPPLVGETLLWRRALGGRIPTPHRRAGSRPIVGPVEKEIAEVSDKQPSQEIQQQLVRRCGADGTEMIDGWVRVNLSAGQRTAWAHVAFCPPFAVMPQLHLTQQSGPPGRVSVGRLLPYGARFNLKLDAANDREQTVLLSFTVTCRSPRAKTVE